MTINEALRLIAGTFILLSLALGYWVHPAWYLFTAFVGLNLLQSGLTKWCPMMWLLGKLGLNRDNGKCALTMIQSAKLGARQSETQGRGDKPWEPRPQGKFLTFSGVLCLLRRR